MSQGSSSAEHRQDREQIGQNSVLPSSIIPLDTEKFSHIGGIRDAYRVRTGYVTPSRLAGELCTDNRRTVIGGDILSNGSRQARAHLNWIVASVTLIDLI